MNKLSRFWGLWAPPSLGAWNDRLRWLCREARLSGYLSAEPPESICLLASAARWTAPSPSAVDCSPWSGARSPGGMAGGSEFRSALGFVQGRDTRSMSSTSSRCLSPLLPYLWRSDVADSSLSVFLPSCRPFARTSRVCSQRNSHEELIVPSRPSWFSSFDVILSFKLPSSLKEHCPWKSTSQQAIHHISPSP